MSTASVDVTCHGRVRHRERVERRSQLVGSLLWGVLRNTGYKRSGIELATYGGRVAVASSVRVRVDEGR